MSDPAMTGGLDGRPESSVLQHAIRLLVLLEGCGGPVKSGDPDGMVAVLRAEMQLQALDFWLRNPDYLAGELLTKIEKDELGVEYLDVVSDLLDSDEPNLHWYPMPRWFHGAYEAIDDAFSVLSSYGLATVRRVGGSNKTVRSQFFLTEAGRDAVSDLKTDILLSWYTKQVSLVRLIAGTDNGSALKKRQYEQAEYAETQLGTKIAPIDDQVRQRLEAARAALNAADQTTGADQQAAEEGEA